MKRIFLVLLIGLFSFINVSWDGLKTDSFTECVEETPSNPLKLYQQLNNASLNYKVFEIAITGFEKLKTQNLLDNPRYLTIIDMSLSSTMERLFIIDLLDKKIVHQSIVSHGKNSGLEYANNFSNTINSHQTSLGFYKTAETYFGKHGLSLRLDGLENSNNNARKRAIVIHSAAYASKSFIQKNGRLGRSYGCPSLPVKGYKEIIKRIKEGSALFIYHPNENYHNNSSIVASR